MATLKPLKSDIIIIEVLSIEINNMSKFEWMLDAAEESPSFSDMLLAFISNKGLDRSEVWRAACIDKRYFSKIICHKEYVPVKRTVMALGLALRLSIDDFETLMRSAGYAFMPSSKFDMAIKIFVEHNEFDIIKTINPFLKEKGLPVFANKIDEKGISKIHEKNSSRRKRTMPEE